MNRTRVRRRRILAVCLLAGAAAVGARAANALLEPGSEPTAAVHVVLPGETLWTIARSTAPGQDPREVVAAIESANGVSAGDLVPGLSLQVPLEA